MKKTILPLLSLLLIASCEIENSLSPAEHVEGVAQLSGKVEANKSMTFPELIMLPDGFNPEGIVAGKGNDLYIGSLFHGGIYKADSRTGNGSLLVQPQERTAVGLAFDNRTNFLFVAGGPDGFAYVYNVISGMEVAAYQLTPLTFPQTFINDVIVTADAAYFTNSFQAEIYKVPLSLSGELPAPEMVETIPLTGDFNLVDGFNANGIVASADGGMLIIAHSSLGVLYLTDPGTGETTTVDLGGILLPSADGLVVKGNTLYAVQNFLNQISVVNLNPGWTSGMITGIITHESFHVPTTAAIKGHTLYAVNAKFDIAPPPFLGGTYDPTVGFEVVKVALP